MNLGHWAKECPYISRQEHNGELINAMGDEFQNIDISEIDREKLPKMFEVEVMIVNSTITQKYVI
jgi:hypothetical protein